MFGKGSFSCNPRQTGSGLGNNSRKLNCFRDDDDDLDEKEENANYKSTSKGIEEDEVDPLDAFM